MTKRIGDVIIIEEEPEGICEECGETAELRPYGEGGKNICFICGMKDETGCKKRMANRFGGGVLVLVDAKALNGVK